MVRMKLKHKLSTLIASMVTTLTSVAAYPGHDEGTATGAMMWGDGGGWMHNGAGMMGYNMWGMGWFGMIFGLAFWILVILAIIYLYQEVTAEDEEEEQ